MYEKLISKRLTSAVLLGDHHRVKVLLEQDERSLLTHLWRTPINFLSRLTGFLAIDVNERIESGDLTALHLACKPGYRYNQPV